MFKPPNSKIPTQAYIQTIYVRNDKYKLYPMLGHMWFTC